MIRALCVILVVLGCNRSAPSSGQPVGAASLDNSSSSTGTSSASPNSPRTTSAKLVEVPASVAQGVSLAKVADGFRRPVTAVAVPKTDLFYVVEQRGVVRLWQRSSDKPGREVFRRRGLANANEQGLLGLALDFDAPGGKQVVLSYTRGDGTSVLAAHSVADDFTIAPRETKILFTQKQPFSNHNGGTIVMRSNRQLYFGLGDGGGAGDPVKAGQRRNTWLAKLIKFDLKDNDVKPQLVHMGLRNPWKFDFDPKTNDLFIADVGQNKWEYVFHVPAGTSQQNFGWNVVEGNHCYQASSCDRSGFTAPIVDYSHAEGLSITGGVVYRGTKLPNAVNGHYFYADFVTGLLRSVQMEDGKVAAHWDWRKSLDPKSSVTQVSSFARDHSGEILLISLSGSIHQIDKK